nr:MAG TPA: hypothetical protein [Caudoviricetes sp.]
MIYEIFHRRITTIKSIKINIFQYEYLHKDINFNTFVLY